MRIHADGLPDAGLQADLSADATWARAAIELALGAAPTALSGQLHVSRLGDGLRVQGEVQATAELPCDRCGEPVRLELSGPVDLFYAPAEQQAVHGGDERALADDELDVGWYAGGALELGDALSEQLAIWAPSRVTCDAPETEHVRCAPTEPGRPCTLAPQDPGPDLERKSPFANLRLPE